MGSTTHQRRGHRVLFAIVAAWIAASSLTLTRPMSEARALTDKPSDSEPPAESTSRPPATVRPKDTQVEPDEKRGIAPPWHENWIPELRHRPGKPPRKTTV